MTTAPSLDSPGTVAELETNCCCCFVAAVVGPRTRQRRLSLHTLTWLMALMLPLLVDDAFLPPAVDAATMSRRNKGNPIFESWRDIINSNRGRLKGKVGYGPASVALSLRSTKRGVLRRRRHLSAWRSMPLSRLSPLLCRRRKRRG